MQDPENAENRLMLPVKNNISKDKEGFSFTIRSVALDSGIETSKVHLEISMFKNLLMKSLRATPEIRGHL